MYYLQKKNMVTRDLQRVEEDGVFHAFVMKWNPKRGNTSLPASFTSNYNVGSTSVVTPENYLETLGI